MKKNFYPALLVITFCFGFTHCIQDNRILYEIKQPTQHKSDLLFLAESTNVEVIGEQELTKFLSTDEKAQGTPFEYKNHGLIHSTELFDLYVLLLSNPEIEKRNYQFELRSYSKKHDLIDVLPFAKWDEVGKKFCYGKIYDDLAIQTFCEPNERMNYKVNLTGRFCKN